MIVRLTVLAARMLCAVVAVNTLAPNLSLADRVLASLALVAIVSIR